jgi:hypothetical protein
MGGIENSIEPKLDVLDPSPHVFFPLTFFMVNDSCKMIPNIFQTMHYIKFHFVSQTYNFCNTNKKGKNVITKKNNHGTTSMNMHILFEHLGV